MGGRDSLTTELDRLLPRLGGALLLGDLGPKWVRDPLAAPPLPAAGRWFLRMEGSPRCSRQAALVDSPPEPPALLAGLWDRWIGADGSELESCCMLTKAPNALISPLHDRMPVILPDGLQEAWLAQTAGAGLRALQPLLAGRDPEGCQTLPPGGGERGPGGSVGPAALRRHYS